MDERENTLKELGRILAELDVQDLLFLREQALVLDSNRKIRQAGAAQADESARSNGDTVPDQKNTAGRAPLDREVRIEQTERAKFFNICVGTSRLFMDYREIQALFRIARAAGNAEASAPRLYRWLKKERSDVLNEVNIPDGKSPVLKQLHRALLENFTTGS